jgi:hypothetical protein
MKAGAEWRHEDEAAATPAVIARGRPLVLNHIPKTAGTSLTEGLITAVQPTAPFHGIDRCALGPFEDVEKLSRWVRKRIIMAPEDIPADADAVFGHIGPATTTARFAEANRLTVLREPRSRLVSHWLFSRAYTNFQLRFFGAWGEYVKTARRPLSEYLANEDVSFYTDNLITRFLVWPHPLTPVDAFIDDHHDQELLDLAVAGFDAFDFIGIIEDPKMKGDLAAWLGRELVLPSSNASPAIPKKLRCDVPAEAEASADLVEQRSRIDGLVWDALAERVGFVQSGGGEAERNRIYEVTIDRHRQNPIGKRRSRVRGALQRRR